MLLSGSIESDNYNGVIEKFEKRSDLMSIEKMLKFHKLVVVHALKWFYGVLYLQCGY